MSAPNLLLRQTVLSSIRSLNVKSAKLSAENNLHLLILEENPNLIF